MEVQVVGHDRRPDDANRHHQHAGLREVGPYHGLPHFQEIGPRLRESEDLDAIADTDGQHEHRDHRLDQSHAKTLQRQQQQHVERCDDDCPLNRDVKQQVQRDRAAQRFGQVGHADGNFHRQPIRPARPLGVPVAAGLGQVLARGHAQAGGNDLQEDGHQTGEPDHPQQPVLELRPSLQIRAPIAGIHVADADQNRRPDKRPPLTPEPGLVRWHVYGAVHAFQRQMAPARHRGRRFARITRRFRRWGFWNISHT